MAPDLITRDYARAGAPQGGLTVLPTEYPLVRPHCSHSYLTYSVLGPREVSHREEHQAETTQCCLALPVSYATPRHTRTQNFILHGVKDSARTCAAEEGRDGGRRLPWHRSGGPVPVAGRPGLGGDQSMCAQHDMQPIHESNPAAQHCGILSGTEQPVDSQCVRTGRVQPSKPRSSAASGRRHLLCMQALLSMGAIMCLSWTR